MTIEARKRQPALRDEPGASRMLLTSGLAGLAVAFAMSTQLLFQFHLYGDWPWEVVLLGWFEHFAELLVVIAAILVAAAGAAAIPTSSRAWKHVLVLASIACGALAGELLLIAKAPLPSTIPVAELLLSRVMRWEVVAGLVYLILVLHREAAATAAHVHEAEVQRVQLTRRMAEAQLESLHAQIEPHFLFNTLANIQRLYQTEPSQGRRLLANFVATVRAALPRQRENETLLGREVALARAYLDVLQIRMGERLAFRIDVPDELAALRFPPLALSTLTENAVKHGLNPLPKGGAIEIDARIDDGCLVVSVADTGAGLRASSGSGAGLANLRARLAALYGDAATLKLRGNAPSGIRATITMPVRRAANGAA